MILVFGFNLMENICLGKYGRKLFRKHNVIRLISSLILILLNQRVVNVYDIVQNNETEIVTKRCYEFSPIYIEIEFQKRENKRTNCWNEKI